MWSVEFLLESFLAYRVLGRPGSNPCGPGHLENPNSFACRCSLCLIRAAREARAREWEAGGFCTRGQDPPGKQLRQGCRVPNMVCQPELAPCSRNPGERARLVGCKQASSAVWLWPGSSHRNHTLHAGCLSGIKHCTKVFKEASGASQCCCQAFVLPIKPDSQDGDENPRQCRCSRWTMQIAGRRGQQLP